MIPTKEQLYTKKDGGNCFKSLDGKREIFVDVNRFGKVFIRVNAYDLNRNNSYNFDKNGYEKAIKFYTEEL